MAAAARLGPHPRVRRRLRAGGDHLRRPQRPRRRGVDDQLENGVYSFQYHPELARDPSLNNGRGTLDYVRYCINLAERSNFWIATQRELYQRMADYEALVFQVRDGGREVTVSNPTDRRIAAMVIEQRLPFGSAFARSSTAKSHHRRLCFLQARLALIPSQECRHDCVHDNRRPQQEAAETADDAHEGEIQQNGRAVGQHAEQRRA